MRLGGGAGGGEDTALAVAWAIPEINITKIMFNKPHTRIYTIYQFLKRKLFESLIQFIIQCLISKCADFSR